MPTVTLDRSREDARLLVAAALERTDDISQYHVGEDRAVGKTGVSLFSWGERVVVEVTGVGPDQTELAVAGEREVWTNITSRPGSVESDFLDQLRDLRGCDSADLAVDTPKRVADPDDLPAGTVALGLFLVVFLPLMMLPTLFFTTDLLGNSLLVLAGGVVWVIGVAVLAYLTTWYYEGTFWQRLPV
jgi:hypothetical protein